MNTITRNWMRIGGISLAIAMMLGSGFAQAGTNPGKGSCKRINQACQTAGFYKGGHKKGPNKGLYKDCMNPILAGTAVPGVTVSPDDVNACKVVKEKRHARRAANAQTPAKS